jgi:phage terminase small subunit
VTARSERAKVEAEDVVAELKALAFANIYDFMRIGENGDPYIDMSTMTTDQAAALAEFKVEDFKGGRGEDARHLRRIRLKMRNKVPALIALGKHLGLFKKQGKRAQR